MSQWIVNRHGVIHEIADDRPAPAGSRPATQQEINAWREQDAKRKKVNASQKQQRKIADAKFVVSTGSAPDDDLTDDDRQDLGEYRADPANPNVPYQDPKPIHSGRPAVYPPTGEPYNPLTGLPHRASGKVPMSAIPPQERTENIPYDPATGDFLRVTPATPLDPNIEPPQGQPGGRPINADVDAEVTPGEPIEVVTTQDGTQVTRKITTREGGTGIVDVGDAQQAQSKQAPQGRAEPPKPESKPPAKK